MAFPDLVLREGGSYWASATGIPVNGNNTFNTNLPSDIDFDPDWVVITVESGGPSVTGASFVSFSDDHSEITMSFTQSGTDPATVTLQVVHSVIR